MEAGIALLLTGSSADLSATVHAVELAQRTNGILHAVYKADRKGERKRVGARETQEQFVALATRLGSQAGVGIHTHILERLTGEPLIRFLCAHRIFCLVLGVNDKKEFERKTAWVNLLRNQLQTNKNWYLPALWSVIMTPWDASTLEHAISEVNSRSRTVMPGESSLAESERADIFSTVLQHNKNE
jgi:K+-sensing histidine kinase KdpD